MYLFKVLFCALFTMVSSICFAGLYAVSPSLLAETEAATIASLAFQTGCATPDLSDSSVDGTAVLEITFDRDAKPVGAEIISSNGSDADNVKIIEALTKRCQYVRTPVNLPLGANKQFTYKWKAHKDFAGLHGCMVFHIDYPPSSVRNNEEGKAVVSYRYSADNAYESKISQSTGYPRLDEVTLKTMNKCLNNHAFKSESGGDKWSEVSMVWRLNKSETTSSDAQQSSMSSSTSSNN